MLQLFLTEPDANGERDSECAKTIIGLLHKLEAAIWSAMISSGGRSEARLWLCKTVSLITSLPPRDQRRLFMDMLRPKSVKGDFASQLWQMIFEERPHVAGSILAKRSHLLEKFFQGNPRRILQWFANFDIGGGSDHKKGSRALAQFAFVNRDICWGELEWKGKHGQSPAMVATKPHYLLDLDVLRTVENFVEYVPEFWSSSEFADSLKDGEVLSLDTKYFIALFVGLMYNDESRDVWEAVDDFLMDVPFSSLCNHLLISLNERGLISFLRLLSQFFGTAVKKKDVYDSCGWLEIILSRCNDLTSIDQLLLINATIHEGRQLLRLMLDEECQEEKEKVEDIISQISKALRISTGFAAFLGECRSMRTMDAVKLLGLHSWVIHYRLPKECQSVESWESLFVTTGIDFKKCGIYPMLDGDGMKQEDSWSKMDNRSTPGLPFKREKRKKKRKRNLEFDHDGVHMDSLYMPDDGLGLEPQTGGWLLSTDGFSVAWTIPDLPEHLAKHCFYVWMKRTFGN